MKCTRVERRRLLRNMVQYGCWRVVGRLVVMVRCTMTWAFVCKYQEERRRGEKEKKGIVKLYYCMGG